MTTLNYLPAPAQKRLSSVWTVYWKFVFPSMWILMFGAATIGVWTGAFRGRGGELPDASMKVLSFIAWLTGSGFLLWFAKRLRCVQLRDDRLWITNYFRETSIPISCIEDVEQSVFIRPHTITIYLSKNTRLGSEIVFLPAGGCWFFTKHPLTKAIEAWIARPSHNTT